ncbi:MAG TPA: ATP-binding cassette domain-containing protein [Oculatellaceae cyanobacterium]
MMSHLTEGDGAASPHNVFPVIQAQGLTKRYGDLSAVNNVDLSIQPGEIFGLIGPDGAGKTSTFHMFGGVMESSAGDLKVFGGAARQSREKIGYLTQQFSLFLDMSIDENIRYVAGLRKVPKEEFQKRKEELLSQMGLAQFRNRLAGQLSGGMKQKLALCCALIARPELLLLDEPTTGVDPVSRRDFWDLLSDVSSNGVTIVVATPYLDEAERCHRIALMYQGSIYKLGSVQELKDSLHLHRLVLTADKLLANEKNIAAALDSVGPPIADVQRFGHRIDVLVTEEESAKPIIKKIAEKHHVPDLRIENDDPSLENVFVNALTSKDNIVPTKHHVVKTMSRKLDGEAAIQAESVSKEFGAFRAVNNVSLQVKYGEIYGLLGANGAGKTTMIKMLCGLVQPSSGTLMLNGQTKAYTDAAVRDRIGYMSQKFTLYNDLTVKENLRFYCGVYGVEPKLRSERINWVLKVSDLEGQENLITGKLPGGWKQRLAFGACIMHDPEILFLDEPTSGVDPLARRLLWELISDLASQGTAVLVTTHFLEEAEHCQRLGFMASGQMVAQGAPEEIRSGQPGKLIEIKTSNNQKALVRLKSALQNWQVAMFADRIHVVLDEPQASQPSLLSDLLQDIELLSSRSISFSLEDAFIGISQRATNRAAAQ